MGMTSAQILFRVRSSLALFGFLIPIPFIGGIGKRTAIVALVLYALLPILRNTYVGLSGIDSAVLEAAEAMGMTSAQILFRVRFPLALSIILAGIRTATVITIGIGTIAAAIGAGGLGTFIFRGVALVSDSLILAGAIPAALLALVADFLLGLLERRLRVV
ncbi:MAG: choline ABC transporter permease [Acidobacteria bacterium]|nr:MAG: choline ABC transporter permease [Acidobacteriota bacterium]